jgi:hypothetical protein
VKGYKEEGLGQSLHHIFGILASEIEVKKPLLLISFPPSGILV